MPDNKSISQLTTAEQTTSSDLFETSIPNGSLGYLSRKVSLDAIADYIGNDHLFASDLQTTNKTLTGAINEAAQSGGGGASIEEMTQAQYNALTPEQKADGTLRAISDASTSIGDIDDVNISSAANGDALIYDSTSSKWVNKELEADAIAYDNTASGLTATDVNAAIDELAELGAYEAVGTTSSNPITCANSTYTECVHLTLDKGLYLFIGMLSFQSNATGVRGINISSVSGNSGYATTRLIVNACITGETRFQTVSVIRVDNNSSNYYLNAWQNSGGNLNVILSSLSAVKIGR